MKKEDNTKKEVKVDKKEIEIFERILSGNNTKVTTTEGEIWCSKVRLGREYIILFNADLGYKAIYLSKILIPLMRIVKVEKYELKKRKINKKTLFKNEQRRITEFNKDFWTGYST